MNVTEYRYEVKYSVYYPDTDKFKPNRYYQVMATSELNAAVKIGQMYNDSEVDKVIDIRGIEKNLSYSRQVQPFGLGE